MNGLQRVDGGSPFDVIRRFRVDGSEFWSARDLQPLMGYARWSNFEIPLLRVMKAASNTGIDVTSNFLGSRKITATKNGGDFQLSRYAAYLVAMNGDPNKPEVAAAQTYFAVQTRKAETTTTAVPSSFAEALELAARQARALEAAETQVAALTPAATAWSVFRDTGAAISVGVAAKYLASRGVDIDRNRLFTVLRELRWVFARSCEPMGAAVSAGLVMPETPARYRHPRTGIVTAAQPTTRLTAAGMQHLAQHFGVSINAQRLTELAAAETPRLSLVDGSA